MKTIAYSYIRFSSKKQEENDSFRRQENMAKEYCKNNDLKLDPTYRDLGFSAYSGDNRKKGALGDFITKVKSGEIDSNSYLIVESMDRLSREEPMEAFKQFLDIIDLGLTLVIFSVNTVFTKESINQKIEQLYIAIGEINRAHNESKLKSTRLKEAWESKRKLGQNKPLTKRRPMWLDWDESKQSFIVIEERAKAIRKIYELYLQGKGTTAIMSYLNDEKNGMWRPDMSKTRKGYVREHKAWAGTTINRYLHGDQRMIGNLELFNRIKGKRVPTGEIIEGYYPAIINEKTYYEVQSKVKERGEKNGNCGGRTGKALNLFPSIVRCGYCGGVMHHINKGHAGDRQDRLYCANRFGQNACKAGSVLYDEVENAVFNNFKELDISIFSLNNDELQKQKVNLRKEIKALDLKIQDTKRRLDIAIDKSLDENISGQRRDSFERQMRAYENILSESEPLLQQKNEELEKLESQDQDLQKQFENVKMIRAEFEVCVNEDKKKDIRLKLREALRNSISSVMIYPAVSNEYKIGYYQGKIGEIRKGKDNSSTSIQVHVKSADSPFKSKVALNSFLKRIEKLEQEEAQSIPNNFTMETKTIEKIIIHFKGEGIKDSEWNNELIQRRTVRLYSPQEWVL